MRGVTQIDNNNNSLCCRTQKHPKSNSTYTCGKKEIHPYYISTIEIGLFRVKITYLVILAQSDPISKGLIY